MGTTEWAVVVIVVGLRLILPLTIPYYPLVGVMACLILDSADQSIFQQFPAIPLDGYQSYDKALDIYYLAIAYMSTMRNWTNRPACLMAKFLFYYRLLGDLLFELTGIRALLIIFPNTFEYFFIFYEAVRTRWNTARVGKWTVIISTVLIWVFIKLPQEWWIHIAKLDMTDFIKESLFGVSKDASWGAAVSAAPWVLAAMIAGLALLVFVVWWMVRRWAPPKDHRIVLRADPLPVEFQSAEFHRTMEATEKIFSRSLLEKFLLTGLVSVIFSQMLGVDTFKLAFVGVFIVLNALVSQWLARRGRTWKSVAVEMIGMGFINLGIIVGLELGERLVGLPGAGTPFEKTLFFVFLLTVLTVLFDRYQAVIKMRGVLRRADDKDESSPSPEPA